jgi:anti-sigma regulatory factor (Ser/Thr protein kinase)
MLTHSSQNRVLHQPWAAGGRRDEHGVAAPAPASAGAPRLAGPEQDQPHTYLTIRLELISRPESVTLVRTLLRALARETGLGSALLDDLCTAVSEACNNVVLHAYPVASGPLIFSCTVRGDSVDAVVSDRGCGIAAGSRSDGGLGMGLAVIQALATTAEFDSGSGSGTEVRMTFGRPGRAMQTGAADQLSPWGLPDSVPLGSGRGASGARRVR